MHGQSQRYVHTRVGVGGRMDTIQCAIVLAKLQLLEEEIRLRNLIGSRYNRLIDEAGIQRVIQRDDRTSVFGQYTIFVENRDELQAELKTAGIPTAVHYPLPLNLQPAYQNFSIKNSTPVAQQISGQVMSLPMGPYLSVDDQNKILSTLCL